MSTYPAYRVCRLCKDRGQPGNRLNRYTPETRLLKYGTRHYAHHACYLDADKSLWELTTWQLEGFPWRLIVDRGPEFVAAFEHMLSFKHAENKARAERFQAAMATRAELAEAKLQRDQLTLEAKPRIYFTEDGYRLVEQSDGTWTDGDFTYANLEQLRAEVDGTLMEG